MPMKLPSPKIIKPDFPKIDISGIRNASEKKKQHKHNSGHKFFSKVTITSMIAIITVCVIIYCILWVSGGTTDWRIYLGNTMGSISATLFIVIILDNIVASNNEARKQRDERRAIIRHNRIIQPVVDMYIVRKNMVITPAEKNIRKFQINSKFTINDMKDMYGPSELISDVGKSKIEMYSHYQSKLQEELIHLVQDVDFAFYPELCDAAMKYINATSYGSSALNAVLSYQDAKAGTKSMKSMIIPLIRDESPNGRFVDAHPAMKNIYLVHQTINDQELAIAEYLGLVQKIMAEEPSDRKTINPDYE